MLFEKAIEIYIDWKHTHATSAPSRYAVRLYQLLNFVGRDKLLSDVTGDDIIRFHRHLQGSRYGSGKLQKQYSPSTVAYSARILKNFFMFWQGRRESNVNHKEILPIRHITSFKQIVTIEDFKMMHEILDERFYDQLKIKLVVNLLWDTGMRISELCDLNISDINNVHPQSGLRSAKVRTRKTMRYNLVAWGKQTDELVNKYLGLRLCLDARTDALFIADRKVSAERLSVRSLQRWVKTVVAKAGLDRGITAHSFRHGKGHHILNTSGGNVRDIFAILRHVRPESSFHYLNLNEDQFMQTASKYLAT